MDEAKKKGLPTWAIVLMVAGVGGVVVLGILSALAIYGVRKYIQSAKRAEGVHAMAQWSKGMVACGEKEGSLPATSAAVPASLASLAGMKYQSVPGEWAEPGFACAGFAMTTPQYFQYQWQQTAPTQGSMVAVADLDGDGTGEERFEVQVSCAGGRCTTSELPVSVAKP